MSKILKHLVCAALTVGLALPAGPTRAAGDGADAVMQLIRPEAIRGDMRFLSDDLLEGRGTATRGHEIAAKFMASEWRAGQCLGMFDHARICPGIYKDE